MAFLEFLAQNWGNIVLVILAVATLVFLWYSGNKKVVFKILYSLVTEAEKIFGSGTGSLKNSTVFTQIYEKMPSLFRHFISVSTIEKWIEQALKKAKKEWDKNGKIQEYISGGAKTLPEETKETV